MAGAGKASGKKQGAGKGAKPPDRRPARARYRETLRYLKNQRRDIARHILGHQGDAQARDFFRQAFGDQGT